MRMATTHRAPTTHAGFSLVETLVAIAILLLALVGPLTVAFKGIQSGLYEREQTTALYLAQEGIEAFVADRNDHEIASLSGGAAYGWSWLPSACMASTNPNGCNIDYHSNSAAYDPLAAVNVVSCSTLSNCALYFNASSPRGPYVLSATGGAATGFTRQLTVSPITGSSGYYVTATVSWKSTSFNQAQQTVSLTRAIYQLY